MTRVSRVTTPVLSSDVHNHRLRSLDLDLEGSNQRVVSIDSDMIRLAVVLKPDCELQRHISKADRGLASVHIELVAEIGLQLADRKARRSSMMLLTR